MQIGIRVKIMSNELISVEVIENRIFIIRDQKVMIDHDLAELYEVKTFILNQSVRRNIKRFPSEFMFQLNDNEKNELITNCYRFKTLVHSTSNPYAFTEHGVVMLASILNSEKAITINVQIVRAFIKLREMTLANKDLSNRVSELEKALIDYAKANNANIEEIFTQLTYLTDLTKPVKIGFKTDNK
jgi:hypothetical protein